MATQLIDGFLKRRQYPQIMKSRKRWHCDRCGWYMDPGTEYEHSLSAEKDADVRLCMTCSGEVPPA